MQRKLLIAAGLTVLSTLQAAAQNLQFNKVVESGLVTHSCTDNLNNLYISGEFGQTLDMDPGPGVVNLVPTYSPQNYNDAFFAKYDAGGNLVWAKKISSANREYITDIAVDASGNVFLTGTFYGLVNFGGPGMGSGDPYYSDIFFGNTIATETAYG